MDVSIIICTRNGAHRLEGTLESLDLVTIPEDLEVELLLVDNGSTDRTGVVLSGYSHPAIRVRALSESRPGKSAALTMAVEASEGEVLLFADDDVRFPVEWIEAMARPVLDGEADAVAGGVTLAPGLERPWMTDRHRTLIGDTDGVDLSGGSQLFGANMAVSRKALLSIDGYDERLGPGGGGYGAAEDTFIALQLQRAGYSILARSDIAIEHHPDDRVLLRSEFRKKAESRGRAEAFLSYHWHHRSWPRHRLLPGWILFKLRELHARYFSSGAPAGAEGISIEEYDAIRRRARIAEHIRLSGQPFDFDSTD